MFQADDGAPKAAKSAPAVKEAKAAAGPSISLPSIGFNAAFLALPSASPPRVHALSPKPAPQVVPVSRCPSVGFDAAFLALPSAASR